MSSSWLTISIYQWHRQPCGLFSVCLWSSRSQKPSLTLGGFSTWPGTRWIISKPCQTSQIGWEPTREASPTSPPSGRQSPGVTVRKSSLNRRKAGENVERRPTKTTFSGDGFDSPTTHSHLGRTHCEQQWFGYLIFVNNGLCEPTVSNNDFDICQQWFWIVCIAGRSRSTCPPASLGTHSRGGNHFKHSRDGS